VNLDEDLEDALGMLFPQSPLNFEDVSMPSLGLHSQHCAADGGAAAAAQSAPICNQRSPLMLPSDKAEAGPGNQQPQKPRRPVGRPRAQAPPPPSAGEGALAVSNGEKGAAEQQQQKRGRGPKPKYIFATNDEALDARKERNRKAALESYYRKRQKTEALNREIRRLEAENARLEQLTVDVATGVVVLEEATEECLNAWLAR
jgi:hypothetical protein